eukprot:2205498-Pyramimonas_sp.AAC.1
MTVGKCSGQGPIESQLRHKELLGPESAGAAGSWPPVAAARGRRKSPHRVGHDLDRLRLALGIA